MTAGKLRVGLAIALAALLACGLVLATRSVSQAGRVHVIAYFDNSNGIYPGDDVLILGVPVGKIDSIEPQPMRAKISFWFDSKYQVPADANAVIISPQLITARSIQLTPTYAGGPSMINGAVIEQNRTAVPVEWDDLRQQLNKLTEYLQPTEPGGVSTFGALVNTAAGNLRGQGANIRDTVIELAQAISTLGDHSGDIFTTIKNLATLVSALHDSAGLMGELNTNLAAVTALLANSPNEVGQAVSDINTAIGDVDSFLAENKDALGTTSDKLAAVTSSVVGSLDDIKQTLHVAPTTIANAVNIFEPAHAAMTGALAVTNFSNPIMFLCGAIQAASRLGAEQSAKLCAQYLAPIFKNRQYNFPPIGLNPIVNNQARPNEITYSEDWLRPDYVPPAPAQSSVSPPDQGALPPAEQTPPLSAEAPPPGDASGGDPTAGLRGLMLPHGSGS